MFKTHYAVIEIDNEFSHFQAIYLIIIKSKGQVEHQELQYSSSYYPPE